MLYEKSNCQRVNFHLENPFKEADRPRHRWYVPCKLTIEWLAALAMLVIFSPLLLVLAGLAKLTSPGPAFYCQTRLGKNGRPFQMYKIRSMRHNCEAKTGPVWATSNDSRVTLIGRFLRDTHLDELPQLWNVLRGDMSLIGPRPERPEMVSRIEAVIPRYRERLLVRPGVTGLAQVRLEADSDLEDVRNKLAHDIHYVQQLSPWLDLRVLLCTVFHLSSLALNAFGRLLVKSYGEAVEQSYDSIVLLEDRQEQVGAA